MEGDHKNKKIEYEKKLKKIAKNKPSVEDASTKAKKDLSVSSKTVKSILKQPSLSNKKSNKKLDIQQNFRKSGTMSVLKSDKVRFT